ncbi:MAG: glycosyltransferase family 39 protein [Capsulimonadaceae bacterium]|nr:glycosyltransferase family 39 protein [Capsulimonadaceae bacterium]
MHRFKQLRSCDLILALLLVVSAFLILNGLDRAALWDDEAQVGVIARNLLKTGHLTGWDGRNLYGYFNGTLLDDRLDYINPPLDVLLAAASIKLLGPTTLAVRLPFALCGIASLIAFLALVRRSFDENPAHRVYAFALFALNVSFILSARTGRYYAISMLCQILVFVLYYRYLERRRLADAVGLVATLIVAFYASYLLAIGTLASVAAVHILRHRRSLSKQDIVPVTIAAGIFAVSTVPYALIHKIWYRPDFVLSVNPWYVDRLTILWRSFRDMNTTATLPWMVAVLLLGLLVVNRRRALPAPPVVYDWLIALAAYFLAVGLFSPMPRTSDPAVADIRYMTGIFPFACGLAGVAAALLSRVSRELAVVLSAVAICSNALTWTPLPERQFPFTSKLRLTLPNLALEEMRPYPTENGAVAEFINRNAAQDDLVMTVPSFFDNSLLFYCGDRVKICGQLYLNAKLSLAEIRKVGPANFVEMSFPDWIVFSRFTPEDVNYLKYFERPQQTPAGAMVSRRYRLAAILPVYGAQTQRPELIWHVFGPVTKYKIESEATYVFERDKSVARAR